MPKSPSPFPLLATLVVVAFLSACSESGQGDAPPSPDQIATWQDFLPLQLDAHQFEARVALTPAERRRGLMQVNAMDEAQGMIFVFENAEQRSFWMVNTPLPLDIGYFDPGGKLLEVYSMRPFDGTGHPSVSRNVQFALEMNQGWFREKGVYPGAQLDMNLLRAAIRQRGFQPSQFGL